MLGKLASATVGYRAFIWANGVKLVFVTGRIVVMVACVGPLTRAKRRKCILVVHSVHHLVVKSRFSSHEGVKMQNAPLRFCVNRTRINASFGMNHQQDQSEEIE